MFKNILIVLGIAAITSSSAFAAAKAPKGPKAPPAAQKLAQAGETKPAAAKADKRVKKDKKVAEPVAAAVEPADPLCLLPRRRRGPGVGRSGCRRRRSRPRGGLPVRRPQPPW